MRITPPALDRFWLCFMVIRVSELALLKPSDQRCDMDRLCSEELLRPRPRREQATMRVEIHLFLVQRQSCVERKAVRRLHCRLFQAGLADTYNILQKIHLLELAARNKSNPFESHLQESKSHDLLFSNRPFPARQFPSVVTSGRSRNEATASPRVTSGSRSCFHAIVPIQTVFIRLHTMTTIMITRLNCSLQCSSVGTQRQY